MGTPLRHHEGNLFYTQRLTKTLGLLTPRTLKEPEILTAMRLLIANHRREATACLNVKRLTPIQRFTRLGNEFNQISTGYPERHEMRTGQKPRIADSEEHGAFGAPSLLPSSSCLSWQAKRPFPVTNSKLVLLYSLVRLYPGIGSFERHIELPHATRHLVILQGPCTPCSPYLMSCL